MKRRRLLGAVVALGAAAALTLTACSSDSDDSQPAPASSDPAATELLNSAADATAALTGAHVTMAVDGSFQSMNATAVEADVNTKPLAGKGTATLNMGGTSVQAPFVYLNDNFYANVDNKGWINYGDGRSIYDVALLLNPDTGIPNVLRSMEGAATAGDEQVDGVATTKVTGTVPAKAIAGLTGATGESAKDSTDAVDTTVWITEDNQVARVIVAPTNELKLTVDVSKWNTTSEVKAPSPIATPSAKPSTPPASDQPTTDKVDG
ncbi:LppX_LprAFG lipoprotein [Gordonia alkaliphila]|uniref:LppX_LprAFG lipoprotein n=1 Tax=Gordonia alkaliphila TaxID=1053547 RepID=A0ABP8ZAM7_9ACTN|nr:LppX_LprAFG lipoprotein [Gordonia alkaliphila]MCK0440189.1 LppX_LprAFG lipoprotein [Gordonia alkaliphila]